MFACLHAPGNAPLLLECAAYFSPLIEETSADTVVFDVRGLRSLYGSPEKLAEEIQRRVGIDASLAIAANPDAAVHAARGIRGVTIVSPKRAAAILAPLPVFLLGGSPEFARTVDLWGIRTFGELAALPVPGVASRLSGEGAHMQQLARGAGRRQLRPIDTPLVFIEEADLEDPIEDLEPLLFLLAQMIEKLCRQLRFHALSTNEIRLRLRLERAPEYCLVLRPPVPILKQKIILKLLQLELREKRPCAAVERIYLEMMPVRPRTTQHGLFLPSAPEPEQLEVTLARIRALVGAENVGAPEMLDTWRNDAYRMAPLTVRAEETPAPLRPKLALRRFRPPCPAQVWCTGEGKPARIFSAIADGRVVACAGPWRTSGDWWSGEEWNRQEWDVEIQGVSVSRVAQDCLLGRWFVEGNYD
jgi:protein ImuB